MSNTKKRAYYSTGRKAKAEETKKRILKEAKSLFKGEGFELVTLEKIAKAAEVSSQMIYLLFQSKRGLLAALMDLRKVNINTKYFCDWNPSTGLMFQNLEKVIKLNSNKKIPLRIFIAQIPRSPLNCGGGV